MEKEWFTWKLEIKVHKTWVEDGYELTEERAHEMVQNDLKFAYPHEIKVKILSKPDEADISKAQGYIVESGNL